MGRPLYTNRSKWQYYTMTDKQNSIKLPISKNGKSCTQEYGCDEIMNGDVVYVEGYKDTLKLLFMIILNINIFILVNKYYLKILFILYICFYQQILIL